jgi:hypothetical protein
VITIYFPSVTGLVDLGMHTSKDTGTFLSMFGLNRAPESLVQPTSTIT